MYTSDRWKEFQSNKKKYDITATFTDVKKKPWPEQLSLYFSINVWNTNIRECKD